MVPIASMLKSKDKAEKLYIFFPEDNIFSVKPSR